MDLNHDYTGTNELLVVGSRERLQLCKCLILAYGDLGYTDPPIPDIRDVLGEYTDSDGVELVRNRIYEILTLSQAVLDNEILSIEVISEEGSDGFIVDLQFTFGSDKFTMAAMP